MKIRILGRVELVVDDQGRWYREVVSGNCCRCWRSPPAKWLPVSALVDALWDVEFAGQPLQRAPGCGSPSCAVRCCGRCVRACRWSTRAPGYLLEVERDQVDALHFADEVAAARAQSATDARRRCSATVRRWQPGEARPWPSSPCPGGPSLKRHG